MTEFLVKRFVKDADDVRNHQVRRSYGNLSSGVGIGLNLFLALVKGIAGFLSGSVSIAADAVNNFSDAGSSMVSLISFRIAAKPADQEHPFGHARIEYVFSALIAVVVMLIGGQFMIESVRKILRPDEVDASPLVVAILAVSILLKIWLFFFYRNIGKRIHSELLKATAADSLADVLSTGVVLLSLLLTPLTGIQLDGYMGVVVAFLILKSGYDILRSGIDLILGNRATEEETRKIEDWILSFDGVLGVHDLIIHDYGPGHRFASVHIEVDSRKDIMESHELVDEIENQALEEHRIQLIGHMDPVDLANPEIRKMRDITEEAVRRVDPGLTIHDVRIVQGHGKMNLIFDCAVPSGLKKPDSVLHLEIQQELDRLHSGYNTVITFDRNYVRGKKRI